MIPPSVTPATESSEDRVLRLVAEALRGLRFGTVTLTVHEGKVTEIESTQRTRLPPTK